MIFIKKKLARKENSISVRVFLLVLLGLGGWSLLTLFQKKPKIIVENFILCDAEKVDNEQFITKGIFFQNGKTQSEEFALSGKFSSKIGLGEGLQYGMGIQLQTFKEGETYRVTVWRFLPKISEAFLVAAEGDGKLFYQSTSMPVEKNTEGWEKLEIVFTVPFQKNWKTLNIHTYTGGKTVAYFDDLKIEKINALASSAFQLQRIELKIKEKGMAKLEGKRKLALRQGILETTDEDWVNAEIFAGGDSTSIPAKIRLKGDWLDHLENDKWSFRIEVKDPFSWNRLKTFSLHTPAARYFLHEWIFHKMLEREDILTTRYDFLEVNLNGKSLGIYAFEEHFEKQLVEFKRRREGPIVKFSEEGFWANYKRQIADFGYINNDIDQPVRRQENAEIQPFSIKETIENQTLANNFANAAALMKQYMRGSKNPSEVFDLERLAKYFAICETLGAHHGVVWHNQRFYYNPVTDRLEPIGFDGFTDAVGHRFAFLGQGATNPFKIDSGDILGQLFLDREFVEKYVRYWYHFSSPAFLAQFLEDVEPELAPRLSWLKTEFPEYDLDYDRIIELAQFTRTQILPFTYSLKAYTEKQNGNNKLLKINSIHHLPIVVAGWGSKADFKFNHPLSPLFLPAQPSRNFWLQTIHPATSGKFEDFENLKAEALQSFAKQEPKTFSDLTVPTEAKFLFFKVLGVDSVFLTEIISWKMPGANTPSQEIFVNISIASNSVYEVQESAIVFKKGKHKITKDIIIPEGYEVTIGEGIDLDFVNGAKFISRSPVAILGSEDAPVRVFSSDKTAGGFTVLQTKLPSKLAYAEFDNLSNLNFKGWTLTGAVTFYEAEVQLHRCIFRRNHCEDALNIIRSDFSMDNCRISQTLFDGFDCDFCVGEISGSVFSEIANDGMDFSGSEIIVKNSKSIDCGDKGISVGEESQVTVFNSTVENCAIGVASKDLSVLVVDNLILKNCKQGFAAYQKKPEFGPSKIIIKKYSESGVKKPFQIATGCTVQIGDKLLKGE